MEMAELKNITYDRAVKMPLFMGEERTPIETHEAVYNVSRGKVASVVSKDYNLVQHDRVVLSVVEALENLNIPAKANLHQFDNKVFVDIEFKDMKLYVGVGEEFTGGVRIVNSYDKTTGIMVMPRLLRLACSNGMVVQAGFVKSFSVRHTSNLAEDFESIISKMMNEMVSNCPKLTAMVNNCIGDSTEWMLMDRILNGLINREKHMVEIRSRLLDSIGNKAPTRWDLYNAVTNYATHGKQLKPSVEQWLQNKAQIVLTTPLANLVPVVVETSKGG